MTVNVTCMNCKEKDRFGTFDNAKKAGWKIASVEIGVRGVIITLCPGCNNRSIFNSVVEAMAKS